MVSKLRRFWNLLKFALPVAGIIFFTSIVSDFSVKLFEWGQTDWTKALIAPFIGIFGIAICIMFLVWGSPRIRKAAATLTGWDES